MEPQITGAAKMSGAGLPNARPVGRALLVASEASRSDAVAALERLGFSCSQSDEPYAAMLEIARRPITYGALVLSLASFYVEELEIIAAVKRRYSHIEIWLAHTDGRQAALVEALRLGADGLLSEDGLHPMGSASAARANRSQAAEPNREVSSHESPIQTRSGNGADAPEADPDRGLAEPVLTADELRALLQEQPTSPPSGEQ